MTAALTMADVARAVGLSAERFRKVWRSWQTQLAFPPPFSQPPKGRYAWRAEAIEEWKRARERTVGLVIPANDDGRALERQADRTSSRRRRQRNELLQLTNRGA